MRIPSSLIDMPATLLRAWRSIDGNAAVEFAVVAPVLVTLILGTVDLASMAFQSAALSAAARAGAEYARTDPADPNGVVPQIINKYMNKTGVTGSAPVEFCECEPAGGGNSTAMSCAGNCAGIVHTYVTVTATISSFKPVLPFGKLVFPASLSASVTTRVS